MLELHAVDREGVDQNHQKPDRKNRGARGGDVCLPEKSVVYHTTTLSLGVRGLGVGRLSGSNSAQKAGCGCGL